MSRARPSGAVGVPFQLNRVDLSQESLHDQGHDDRHDTTDH